MTSPTNPSQQNKKPTLIDTRVKMQDKRQKSPQKHSEKTQINVKCVKDWQLLSLQQTPKDNGMVCVLNVLKITKDLRLLHPTETGKPGTFRQKYLQHSLINKFCKYILQAEVKWYQREGLKTKEEMRGNNDISILSK